MEVNERIDAHRTGRKWTRRFPNGRTALGYDVLVDAPAPGGGRQAIAQAFATQTFDDWGRSKGWIVLDLDGNVVMGLGASTRVGLGLGDCLFMYAEHIEKEKDR